MPLRQPPKYPVESVDHALMLMEMVRDYGRVRLSVAARLLGVSVSTAHRLMGMLVYRGYAVQDGSRRYIPGPALGVAPAGVPWTAELRHRAAPHLEILAGRVRETANLMVRAGTEVRFLVSVEGGHALHVGSRQGVTLPAARASGGKALLAALAPADVERLYRQHAELVGSPFDAREQARLAIELEVVRARGVALNDETTEEGVGAVGTVVRDGSGAAVAGLTLAVPRDRFRAALNDGMVAELLRSRAELEADLRGFVAATW
ncbi:IclR family transcriptional regulator C-terminal domain-containing protein [Citricoccus sp. NPDC055426]|uniref:IclR family transcriptional regulator n=1 Tax=Citricoccus sp. NPDC055426 TaxID=3155536 RepID=UPI003440FE07